MSSALHRQINKIHWQERNGSWLPRKWGSHFRCHQPDHHEQIQDVFNEFGVQIMSPNFEAQPEQPVPFPKDRWFEAPAKESGNEQDGNSAALLPGVNGLFRIPLRAVKPQVVLVPSRGGHHGLIRYGQTAALGRDHRQAACPLRTQDGIFRQRAR